MADILDLPNDGHYFVQTLDGRRFVWEHVGDGWRHRDDLSDPAPTPVKITTPPLIFGFDVQRPAPVEQTWRPDQATDGSYLPTAGPPGPPTYEVWAHEEKIHRIDASVPNGNNR